MIIWNIAQDNSVSSICINSILPDMEYFEDCRTWIILKMICSDASNVICYDLHTITRLSSGCRNLHSECKATYI